MISNQILQDTIDGIKAITRIDLCVMDTEGTGICRISGRESGIAGISVF